MTSRSSKRLSTATAATAARYTHPYLPTTATPATAKKREFGICNIFAFKLCGCFSVADDLPPPNLQTPIYQGAKSTSSNFTFNSATTAHTSRTNSPGKPSHAPSLATTITTTASDATKYGFVGSTGVEDIPYRRPPPRSSKPRTLDGPSSMASSVSRASRASRTSPSLHNSVQFPVPPDHHFSTSHPQKPEWKRISDTTSKPPVELAEPDDVEAGKFVSNVSRLSSMFQQE